MAATPIARTFEDREPSNHSESTRDTEQSSVSNQAFTLHLVFPADDLGDARDLAVIYMEGLTILRPEIPLFEARLSAAGCWDRTETVFCCSPGPDGELCADVMDHPGFHRAPGVAGLRWGDGDAR